MVFGAIKGKAGRHWRRNVLGPGFLAVAIDVDVEAFLSDIMSEVADWVVVVADDLTPAAFESVLQLNDEPGDLPAAVAEADSNPERIREWLRVFSVVVPR
ncbi:hypothetical protein GJ631_02100 [Natronomonas sp. CBA1123]|uniref:hypothetical protein n=1 Tax=Natronomonas sp. CBA1123 TaxID=2668070 RepID=UPI0012EA4E22|nr:hypothetical protein [Natronomonas sp. CBA1123]MUV85408.1 hypothetical protein [Natronomonas sp. CBA1123]